MPATPEHSAKDDSRAVLADFAYAIPAALAIVLQAGLAIGYISGLVAHARTPDPFALDLAFLLAGLGVSIAGTIASGLLWRRRSWFVLVAPLVAVPIAILLGAAWGVANWGG